MIIDEAHGNQLVSARTYPGLVLIKVHVTQTSLEVEFPARADEDSSRVVIVDLQEVAQRRVVKQAM